MYYFFNVNVVRQSTIVFLVADQRYAEAFSFRFSSAMHRCTRSKKGRSLDMIEMTRGLIGIDGGINWVDRTPVYNLLLEGRPQGREGTREG